MDTCKKPPAPNYITLDRVLKRAYEQATMGKGAERHGNMYEDFADQPMCEIARRLRGHPAGSLLYQAVKKSYESGRLPKDAAIRELLGAIVYLCGAVIIMDELSDAVPTVDAPSKP